jgi:hypothetical protein
MLNSIIIDPQDFNTELYGLSENYIVNIKVVDIANLGK